MTLDDWFNQVKGTIIDIDGHPADAGQCVQTADDCLHKVYGLPYHYGNAIDWWNNPQELLNNFTQVADSSVHKGDFVVFNQTVGSVYGHIDIAMNNGTYSNFTGADSNWQGDLTVHLVQHTTASQVLGTLRYKGGTMIPNAEIVQSLYIHYWGRQPNQTEINDWVGQNVFDLIADLEKDPQATAWFDAAQGNLNKISVTSYVQEHLT